MQAQEGCAEACAERGSRLGDAALCAGQLGGIAAQEVILCLLGGEYAHGRQHTVCIGAQEDHVLCIGTCGRCNDVADVIDRIAYAGILGHALVSEVDVAFGVHGNVLQQGITTDGVEDIGFALLVQVDNLGIAAALVVEHAVVVPAMFVIADKQTLGICRKSGLAGA